MSEYAVKITNLNMHYKKTHALKNLSIDINKNNLIGLIGSNGSGKTTLFKLCAGFLKETSGSIEILDGDPLRDIRIKEKMIYSMHNLPIGEKEKIKWVISYYQDAYPTFDKVFANKLMELFELNTKKSYKVLSQGTKSLFHFICALATRCEVTMLDEPFIGVDIVKRKMAYEILLRDYMEHPRTIIVSSHNLAEMDGILSEMILINEGNLIFYRDMDTVREMAFRAEGSMDVIKEIAKIHKMIYGSEGTVNSFGIFEGSTASKAALEAKTVGLTISSVSAEDICVYTTSQSKERDIECLWN